MESRIGGSTNSQIRGFSIHGVTLLIFTIHRFMETWIHRLMDSRYRGFMDSRVTVHGFTIH